MPCTELVLIEQIYTKSRFARKVPFHVLLRVNMPDMDNIHYMTVTCLNKIEVRNLSIKTTSLGTS